MRLDRSSCVRVRARVVLVTLRGALPDSKWVTFKTLQRSDQSLSICLVFGYVFGLETSKTAFEWYVSNNCVYVVQLGSAHGENELPRDKVHKLALQGVSRRPFIVISKFSCFSLFTNIIIHFLLQIWIRRDSSNRNSLFRMKNHCK